MYRRIDYTIAVKVAGLQRTMVSDATRSEFLRVDPAQVQAWLDATGGVDGVDLYSVSTSMNSGRDNYPPSEWLAAEGWTQPVIRDDNENTVLINYGAGGFPYWVFLNADGTVALRTSGQLEIEQLENILLSLEQ